MSESGGPGFIPLAWDSEAFGFPVAKLSPHLPETLLDSLRKEGIRLAYGVVSWDDQKGRAEMEREGAVLVDHKVRYRKTWIEKPNLALDLARWLSVDTSPALEALALASGHKSRFKIDARMPSHVFHELYLAWIQRSVRGEIADGVLIAGTLLNPLGMVTVALKEGVAEIGLIAVDEGARGQGMGRRLVTGAEIFGHHRGARSLEVVTQGTNPEACALYEACGYRVVLEQAIYHLWVEPKP